MDKRIEEGEFLQFVTNQWSKNSIPTQIREVCKGGCRWIQLRLKNTNPDQWIKTGLEAKAICRDFGAKLIINDHVEFTYRLEADGVHLGKEDMDPVKAREILGNHKIIGGTANHWEEILELYKKGVDYAGLGPYRYTKTKKNLSGLLGVEGFRETMNRLRARNISLPIFAIGGITPEDIGELMQTGIQGVAVSSFLSDNPEISNKTKEFIYKIKQNAQYVNHRK